MFLSERCVIEEQPKPIEFKVDHPFLVSLIYRQEINNVLFLGRIMHVNQH